MPKRIHFRLGWIVLFILSASFTSAHAQSGTKRQFDITEDGRLVAKVATETSAEVQRASIYRSRQPVRVYNSFPSVSAGSVYVGERRALAFFAGDNRVELGDASTGVPVSSFIANAVARAGHGEVKTLRRSLADDMRILRAVRVYERSVELHEVLFVIATGDESFFLGAPSTALQVTETNTNRRHHALENKSARPQDQL